MTVRRASVTIALERELTGPQGGAERVRLSARFDAVGETPAEPTTEEMRAALERLRLELTALVGPGTGPATGARGLEELVETYRPRQSELVELLRSDGEISPPEADLLLAYLAMSPPAPGAPLPPAPGVPPPTDRPIAAVPLENDRTPSTPRPTTQLLEQYRIENLKQAGAVRARRQISFEEYMALKRHFSAATAARPASPGSAEATSEAHPSGGGEQ